MPAPHISGNVYIAGDIPLGDTPLSIKGGVVIGLAHDNSGHVAGFDRSTGNAVLKGTESLTALAKTLSAFPVIGVNGELEVGKDFGGGTFALQATIGKAVAYFVPNMTNPFPNGLTQDDLKKMQLSLHGDLLDEFVQSKSILPSFTSGPAFVIYATSVHPWDGTVIAPTMNKILPAETFNLNAIVDASKNWAFEMTGAINGVLGITTTPLQVQASSLSQNIHVQAQTKTVFDLANLTLEGSVNTATGEFHVGESTSFEFGIPTLATVSLSESLRLGYTGGTNGTTSIDFDLNASAGCVVGTVSLSAHAGLSVSTDGGLSLDGTVGGEVDLNGHQVGSVSFDSKRLTVSVGTAPPAKHDWLNGPTGDLTSDGPALVGSPANLNFFVPPGMTDPVHFSAALSPDGLAANYDAAGTDPHVSFTFTAPGTYTVYGRMYLADGEVSDYQTTVTAYGSDQDNGYFVERLYHDLLGRASDSSGLAYYTWALTHGANRVQVIEGFLHSQEYLQDVVHSAYHDLLGRFADPVGLSGWVSYLQAGHTADELRLQIVSSAEYSQRHADDSSFVEGLYQDVLGRMGTAAEVDYYTQVLAGTASRAEVAQAFFASTEHQTRLTEQIYQKFLRRDADPSGLFYYTQALNHGANESSVMDAVLISPEYAPPA